MIAVLGLWSNMSRECGRLLDGKFGVAIGIVESIACVDGVTVRCAGLFIRERRS